MTKLLSGPALTLNLRNRGIEVASSSAPKQTETTQRWEMALAVQGRALPQPTKIEFSRGSEERNGLVLRQDARRDRLEDRLLGRSPATIPSAPRSGRR